MTARSSAISRWDRSVRTASPTYRSAGSAESWGGCRRGSVGEAQLPVGSPTLGVLRVEDGNVRVDVIVDDDVGLAFISPQRAADGLDHQAGVGDGPDEEDGIDDRCIESFTAIRDGRQDE